MADEFDNLESQPTGSSQGLDIQGYLNTVEARKREAQQQMDKLIRALDVRRNMPFDPVMMRVAGALLSPTKTGSFGESLGYAATAGAEEAEKQAARGIDLAKLEFELGQKKLEQQGAMDELALAQQLFSAQAPTATVPTAVTTQQPPSDQIGQIVQAATASAEPTPMVGRRMAELQRMAQEEGQEPPIVSAAPTAPAAPAARYMNLTDAQIAMLPQGLRERVIQAKEQERKERALKVQEAKLKVEQRVKWKQGDTEINFEPEDWKSIQDFIKNKDFQSANRMFALYQAPPQFVQDPDAPTGWRRISQEERDRDSAWAKQTGSVERVIGGEKYFLSPVKARQHDNAEAQGDQAYERWVRQNIFGQKPDVVSATTVFKEKPAEKAAAAPSVTEPPKKITPKSKEAVELEQSGKTELQKEGIKSQIKKSDELVTQVESSLERSRAADTVLGLLNDPKAVGAQGYFADPTVKNALVNFFKDTIRLGNVNVGIPAIADSLQQAGMTETEANAKATIIQQAGLIALEIAAMQKGATSNYEQRLYANIAGSIDTPVLAMKAQMSTIKAKAVFDQNNNIAFEKWREKNPYMSAGKYFASSEYMDVKNGYLNEVRKINNFYYPSAPIKGEAVDQKSGGVKPTQTKESKFLQ